MDETCCVRTLCKSQEDKKKPSHVPYPKIIYKEKHQTKGVTISSSLDVFPQKEKTIKKMEPYR